MPSPSAGFAGPPTDLSIGPGRLYVDGIQIEAFAEDGATYNHQPFYPPQLAPFPPPALPAAGDAVVYLDVWDREVTYIEDAALLDVALGGADTTTRRQTVWQVRVDPMPGAACGVPVGEPPSAGRLTSRAIAPPAPDDPCILPPASGYRGLENRLYRVEIHNGGALGTARFKWSRDNGSIVSAVRDIAVSGTQTTLTVNRIGRDQFLRFRVGDWVTVTDDHRELTGQPGEMALIVNIDETNRQIVLDRALPTPGQRPFGANAAQIAERHTRVQRWDQTGATNTVDGDGLIVTGAGPIPIEDGIEIEFSTDPAGGSFRVGDYWVFWARTATAQIEELTNAPPRGIVHHYMQLAAITGLGGRPADDHRLPATAATAWRLLLHDHRAARREHPGRHRCLAGAGRLCVPQDRTARHPRAAAYRARQHRARGGESGNDRAVVGQRAGSDHRQSGRLQDRGHRCARHRLRCEFHRRQR